MTLKSLQDDAEKLARQIAVDRLPPDAGAIFRLRDIVREAHDIDRQPDLEGWVADGRDADGNLILRYRDTGGLYRVVPIEES